MRWRSWNGAVSARLARIAARGRAAGKQPGRRFCHALEQSQAQFRVLSKQLLPLFFQGLRPLGIFLLLWLLAACPLLAMFKAFVWWNWWHWAGRHQRRGPGGRTGGRRVDLSHRQAKVGRGVSGPALHQLEAGLGYPNVLEYGQSRVPAPRCNHYRSP